MKNIENDKKQWTPNRTWICTVDKATTCFEMNLCITPCDVVLNMEKFQEEEKENEK